MQIQSLQYIKFYRQEPLWFYCIKLFTHASTAYTDCSCRGKGLWDRNIFLGKICNEKVYIYFCIGFSISAPGGFWNFTFLLFHCHIWCFYCYIIYDFHSNIIIDNSFYNLLLNLSHILGTSVQSWLKESSCCIRTHGLVGELGNLMAIINILIPMISNHLEFIIC